MTPLSSFAYALLIVAGVPLVLFAGYPVALAVRAAIGGRQRDAGTGPGGALPAVSLVVVVRNAADLIEQKLRNCLALDYPSELLEIVFHSDGSTDGTEQILRRHEGSRILVLATAGHEGKIRGMNRAVERCSGQILAFSDGDARLEPRAIRVLVRHYDDPGVGGVTGRTVIGERDASLVRAQDTYLGLNARLRLLESRLGSVTSSEGKLHSIRRELYRPIPEGVTDDLYIALTAVAAGYRYTFEPDAVASIRVPSRNAAHEIRRRRRIVSQSLRGIWLMRRVLDPFTTGGFAFGLAANKIARRLLPFSLLALLAATLLLAPRHAWAAWAFACQAAFWALGLLHPALSRLPVPGPLVRGSEIAFYVAVGQWGTMLGVLDFLARRSVVRWEPVKSGGTDGRRREGGATSS